MKKYINKHFEKNFIKPSLLVAVALVLLIRKPSGKIRFCIDYRVLNKITAKKKKSKFIKEKKNRKNFIK